MITIANKCSSQTNFKYMEKLINKYEENLSILLKKHNVDEIMKIDDIQDRTRARDFRDFIEELKELHLFAVSSSRRGGYVCGVLMCFICCYNYVI